MGIAKDALGNVIIQSVCIQIKKTPCDWRITINGDPRHAIVMMMFMLVKN